MDVNTPMFAPTVDDFKKAIEPGLMAAIPQPATSAPPAVADASAQGTSPLYALANHTHASKARKARMQCAANGSLSWTFDPPFAAGVIPRVVAIAETAVGITDVINVQVEGTPTNTGANLRVTRTQLSAVSLLGLTILSIPASVGATWVHAVALEP